MSRRGSVPALLPCIMHITGFYDDHFVLERRLSDEAVLVRTRADADASSCPFYEVRKFELHVSANVEGDNMFAAMLCEMLYPGYVLHTELQAKFPGLVQNIVECWVELDDIHDDDEDEGEEPDQADNNDPDPNSNGPKDKLATLFVLFESLDDCLTLAEVDRKRRVALKAATAPAEPRWTDAELTTLLKNGVDLMHRAAEVEERLAAERRRDFGVLPFGTSTIVCTGATRRNIVLPNDDEEGGDGGEDEVDLNATRNTVSQYHDANHRQKVSLRRFNHFKILAQAFFSMGVGDASAIVASSPLEAPLAAGVDPFEAGPRGMTFLLGITLLELAMTIPAASFDKSSAAWHRVTALIGLADPDAAFRQKQKEARQRKQEREGAADEEDDVGEEEGDDDESKKEQKPPGSDSLLPVDSNTGHVIYNPVLRAIMVQAVSPRHDHRPLPRQLLTTLKSFNIADRNPAAPKRSTKHSGNDGNDGVTVQPYAPLAEGTTNGGGGQASQQKTSPRSAGASGRNGEAAGMPMVPCAPGSSTETKPSPSPRGISGLNRFATQAQFAASKRRVINKALTAREFRQGDVVPRNKRNVGVHHSSYSTRSGGSKGQLTVGAVRAAASFGSSLRGDRPVSARWGRAQSIHMLGNEEDASGGLGASLRRRQSTASNYSARSGNSCTPRPPGASGSASRRRHRGKSISGELQSELGAATL